jgi:hypothetical protein
MSVTCRRTIPVSGVPDRSLPHRSQQVGSCRITRSGRSVSYIVAPGCPFGRPGRRPDLFRSDFGKAWQGHRKMAAWRSSSSSARLAPPNPRVGPEAQRPAPAARRPPHPSRPAAPAAGHWQRAARQRHRGRRAYRARAAGSHTRPPVINPTRMAGHQRPALPKRGLPLVLEGGSGLPAIVLTS